MKQISLLTLPKRSKSHGGDLAQGKRKSARPFDPKQATHLVLRSSKAREKWSMLHPRHSSAIETHVHKVAHKWGVQVYRFANVGNHLHLLVRARTRRAFQSFLREISGAIAMIVTGARKAAGLKNNDSGRGFWDHLAFTRIVQWGRDYDSTYKYLVKNLFESMGVPVKKLLAQGYRVTSLKEELKRLEHPPPSRHTLGHPS